jgi:predicted nuclease with TOPRIM domain
MDHDDQSRERSKSDSQPPDLNREREEVLRSFATGGRLIEDLQGELLRLRDRIAQLDVENARLRATVEAAETIRELLRRIDALEGENRELLTRFHEAEAFSTHYNERFAQVEQEFANMANLFVASNQLHSSMSPRRVTRRIKEVLAQLLGAERYCMYLVDERGYELVPVASEGVIGSELMPIQIEGTRVGAAFRGGSALVEEGADPSRGTLSDPAAVIPLSIDDKVVGVIAIFSTLSQKNSFETIDFELFKLLGQHAAGALVSAGLFVQAEQKIPGLEAFLDLSV